MMVLKDETCDNLIEGIKGLIEKAKTQLEFANQKFISTELRYIRYARLRQTYGRICGMYEVLYCIRFSDGSFLEDTEDMKQIVKEKEKLEEEIRKVMEK